MKLVSCLAVCVALSGCATNYVAELSGPNFGKRDSLHYLDGGLDPTLLMNGYYASKQLNGVYQPLNYVCLTDARCTSQVPLGASGWEP